MSVVRTRDTYLYGGLAVVLVIVVGLVTLAMWRNSTTDALVSVTPTVTAGAPSAETTDEASTKALAAYDGYWSVYVAAAADPAAPAPDLARYVADPMLTELRLTLRQFRDNGIVHKGRPTSKPHPTSINTTTAPFSVVIEDCFDSSGWEPVFATTGQSAAVPGQATRYVITTTVKLYQARGWLLVESRADRSRSC